LVENDFFAKTGLSNGESLEEFFKKRPVEEEYVLPIFTDYKLVSLD